MNISLDKWPIQFTNLLELGLIYNYEKMIENLQFYNFGSAWKVQITNLQYIYVLIVFEKYTEKQNHVS